VPSEGWWSQGRLEDKTDSGRRAARERVARVAQWLRELRPAAPQGPRHVIIIGHGALLSRLLGEMLGVPSGSCLFSHGNTAVTHIELRGSHLVHVHHLNWMPSKSQPSASAALSSVAS